MSGPVRYGTLMPTQRGPVARVAALPGSTTPAATLDAPRASAAPSRAEQPMRPFRLPGRISASLCAAPGWSINGLAGATDRLSDALRDAGRTPDPRASAEPKLFDDEPEEAGE